MFEVSLHSVHLGRHEQLQKPVTRSCRYLGLPQKFNGYRIQDLVLCGISCMTIHTKIASLVRFFFPRSLRSDLEVIFTSAIGMCPRFHRRDHKTGGRRRFQCKTAPREGEATVPLPLWLAGLEGRGLLASEVISNMGFTTK